ncbi:glycosyltransferase family 2 protein [Lutimaribacter sp. EGI FJ00013]|uniref:Glycosyltransferase family 2 protein n=1 Tax=Lutimaribacter degradans TaxID=2945989 RepID=A0ACC5ZVI9_9RHOB|nr:glycosyltransferase family 2 protein [Lutimaribacter sp. EGI FJ00013]
MNEIDEAGRVSASSPVTIVTVAYNSMAKMPDMLASVPPGTPVVVVDNGSSDLAALATLCDAHGATLIRNAENLGFGRACNQGADHAKTPFILFLNPDARLFPDTLDELLAAAERRPDVSAMNPRIEEADGRPHVKRKSHLMPRSEWMPRGWPAQDQEVSVLSGSAFFVRREAFESVGGFDPAIFLFHEDDDLALRLRRDVGPLYFARAARVVHLAGESSARTPRIAALKAWHMGRSRVYAARKHGQRGAGVKALVQAVVQLLSPDMLLSARKRAKNWAFFRGVLAEMLRPTRPGPERDMP